jgi:hypothetical protein
MLSTLAMADALAELEKVLFEADKLIASFSPSLPMKKA